MDRQSIIEHIPRLRRYARALSIDGDVDLEPRHARRRFDDLAVPVLGCPVRLLVERDEARHVEAQPEVAEARPIADPVTRLERGAIGRPGQPARFTSERAALEIRDGDRRRHGQRRKVERRKPRALCQRDSQGQPAHHH